MRTDTDFGVSKTWASGSAISWLCDLEQGIVSKYPEYCLCEVGGMKVHPQPPFREREAGKNQR